MKTRRSFFSAIAANVAALFGAKTLSAHMGSNIDGHGGVYLPLDGEWLMTTNISCKDTGPITLAAVEEALQSFPSPNTIPASIEVSQELYELMTKVFREKTDPTSMAKTISIRSLSVQPRSYLQDREFIVWSAAGTVMQYRGRYSEPGC